MLLLVVDQNEEPAIGVVKRIDAHRSPPSDLVDICGTSSKPYFVGVTAVTNLGVTAVTGKLRARTRPGPTRSPTDCMVAGAAKRTGKAASQAFRTQHMEAIVETA